jgi:tRNA threonylcarbamoyladenosine biosynthesis protein TsaB
MLILAMDQSTGRGSLALLRDDRLVGEVSWMDSRRHSQQLFDRLIELQARTSVGITQVDCLAVGLGPGSYTGLRIAMSAALGLALPDQRSVYGVGSAEALAGDVLAESGAASVMVIGDARRGRLWGRVFSLREGLCVASTPWLLSPPDSLAKAGAALWVTSDWERIGTLLKAQAPAACRLIGERRIPTAPAVGRAALRRMRAVVPSDPLAPIYLHPAVATPGPALDSK